MEFNKASKILVEETSVNEGFKPDNTASCDTSIDVVTLRSRLHRLSTSRSSSSASSSDPTSLSSVASSDSICSLGTNEMCKHDRGTARTCKEEELTSSNDITSAKIEDPYHTWECGFGYNADLDRSTEIPNTKTEFVKAVKGEMTTIGFIQNGLTSYNDAIHSGVHHTFSKEFLTHTTDATHKTIDQLFQISRNLQNVVTELEAVEGGSLEVKVELKQAYAHAKPWIQRARAILVSSHVFYKINYVLGSEKNKH